MTCRPSYDTDLTDPEWDHLQPLVPAAKPGGRPPKHTRREILNGIFYAVRSGCAWKLLPHDLPPWRTVYHYFWSWRRKGHGTRFTTVFADRCARQQAAIRNRVVRSSTANQYRPLNKVAYEVRCREERLWAQTAPARRHARPGAAGCGHGGQCAGPGSSPDLVDYAGREFPAFACGVG